MFRSFKKIKFSTSLLITSLLMPVTSVIAENHSMLIFNFNDQPQLHTQQYNDENGFGVDNFKNSTENAFSVKMDEGDYQVTVTVKGKKSNNTFLIFSEDRRVMTPISTINNNEIQQFSFYVNVKNTLLAQSEHDNSNTPRVRIRGDEYVSRNWDNKLTIALSNQSVQFNNIQIESVNIAKILLAGDSTVTDQTSSDYASWGQFLPALISNRLIVNHARSGETLKSFITSLRWDKTLSHTNAGDIVLIQFAHNDEKKQWPRTYATANGAYPEYLRAFIADVRQKGAYPVLVTPVARRIYDKKGQLVNTHAGYDQAVRNIAQAKKVPVIDLTAQTSQLYQALSKINVPKIFANQGKDKTHHNHLGAFLIANMVANNLQVIYPTLTKLVDTDVNLLNPNVTNAVRFNQALWPDMRHVKVAISGN